MDKIKKMYFVWALIVILIFVILTVFGFMYKNKTSVYKELEERLVNIAKKYVDAKFLYPEGNEKLIIKKDELIENGYLISLNILDETHDEECDGYATIQRKGTVFDYKGYVKCSNYTTKGYEN